MAFVDQDRSREKLLSGIASAALVGIVGYALVTGLAINIIRDAGKQVFLQDWKADMPPPPPPIRQKVDKTPKAVAHPVFVEKAIVPPLTPTKPQIETSETLVPIPQLGLKLDIAPSQPASQPDKSVGARPKSNPGGWVTTDDYPPSALRNSQEGRTSFRLDIGLDGRPTACSITQSSGSTDLDRATCQTVMRRARFNPATDAAGTPVASSYSNNVLWRLPRD